MSSSKAIGGYFSLELSSSHPRYDVGATALNSARNAIEYILEATRPSRVYIPYYTCDVVLEPFEKTGITYEFYSINENLEITTLPDLKDGDLLIYNNYFGIKNDYSQHLATTYGSKLIIDASQAFYYTQSHGEKIVYSPRKFFGMPDGGFVITDTVLERNLEKDVSTDRMSHLIKRLELDAEDGYADFQENDKKLEHQPIMGMSDLSRKIFESIDHDIVKQRRAENFAILHQALSDSNRLIININDDAVPMVYPYFVQDASALRKSLIDERIFVATYWPNVFEWTQSDSVEYDLAKNVIPIPVDQRYDGADMERILEVIHASNY